MSTVTQAPPRKARRALGVGVAAALGLAVWTIADPVLGTDLAVRTGGSGTAPLAVGPVAVVVTAILAGLAGWGLLALLERLAPRVAGKAWRVTAAVVLLISLLGPLGGVDAATKLTLLALHLTVGLTLLVTLPRH